MIFVRYPFDCQLKYLNFNEIPVTSNAVKDVIASYLGYKDFLLLHNGKILHDEEIPYNSTVHVTFSLPGGKGGFGSMLRAIGAQIEKTTNREACRDLSGRRLRDINEEQRLKKWIAKEAEREAEKLKRRQARLERLKRQPAHKFFDFEYEKEISELPERVSEALQEGLQKVKQPNKRPLEKSDGSEIPKKSWLSDDLPVSSSNSDSDENTESKGSPSKKPKTMVFDSSSCDSDVSYSSQSQQASSKENSCLVRLHSGQIGSSSASCSSSNVIFSIGDEENLKKVDTDSEETKSHKIEYKNHSEESSENSNNELCVKIKNDAEKTMECSRSASELKEDIKLENEALTDSKNLASLANKEPEQQDYPPINLMDFENISDLEELGLDRLKAALMSRGLKCGGTLVDRAQRLWKIRSLQPHEYPTNLLAKNKK